MSNQDGIDQALAKAFEVRALKERALTPSPGIADIVKAIQPHSHIAFFEAIAKTMKPPAFLTVLSQMVEAMQLEHRLFAYSAHPPRFLEDFTSKINQMRAISESITAPYNAIQEMFRSQFVVFEGLSAQVTALNAINFNISQFSQAMLVWNVASIRLTNRMKDIGLLAQREMLSVRLFEASFAYAAFVRHTTELLADNSTPDIASRLRGSLNLAKLQLLDITDTVCGFLEVPYDDEEPANKRVLNALLTQQDELLAYDAFKDESDTKAMATGSPTAQTMQRARQVLKLVNQCNEAGKTSKNGEEIFKPTGRMMTVFTDLPLISSSDRYRFADVIDCLYFIFYEGAGADKLRFLDKHGGPLTDADCDLIWCIKHLRNKWSRHDVDHGNEKKIQESWSKLAAAFRWLGLAKYPTEEHHFQQLHYQLLVRAETFLAGILSKLNLKR